MTDLTDPVLAIDFGTSGTCATLADGSRTRQLREPASGNWSWPSAVFIDGNLPRVGTLAVTHKRLAPADHRDELKRYLGQDTPLRLAGRSYRPTVLVTALLQSVRAEAERLNGGPLGRAVLTVPASYGPGDIRLTDLLAAAHAAGIPAPEVVPEPVAAAFAPLAGGPLPPGTTVLVHDFGGGTFDTAVVTIEEDGHQVLGHATLDDCGGRDIDAAVVGYLRDVGGEGLRRLLDGPDEAADRARMDLRDFAQRLKHRLGAETTATDVFTPAEVRLTLDRQRLDTLVRPLLEQTTDRCAELLRTVRSEHTATRPEAHPPPVVSAVVAVGGCSRLPGVSEHLARTLRLPVRQAEDPQTAVSQGAAAWALRGTAGRAGRRTPSLGPAQDRTPLSWALPPGASTLLSWRVPQGGRFTVGSVLAQVRAPDGSLLDLTVTRAGTVTRFHAGVGDQVLSGDWLVTTTAG
ncbi:Hsp70 family protein [Streptomyces sp. NPDC058653]|uniref:Hsp70 family protein n=1 Tax=Streptomyces sp. NPDC058653 TaxID=3346576 RepID=UPI003666AE81